MGGLLPALQRGSEIGADVVQVFTQSPRAWKPTLYSDDTLRAYRETQQAEDRVQATFGRATRLVNLAAADHEVLNRSWRRLTANFAIATAIGRRVWSCTWAATEAEVSRRASTRSSRDC